MWQSSLLVRFLWVASPIVQLVMAAFMLRAKLSSRFPMFFVYTIFRAITSLILFFLYVAHLLDGSAFAYALWLHETGCILLRFAVLYELFAVVLKPYSSLRQTADSIFRWGIAALLLIAALLSVYQSWGPFSARFAAGLNLVDRTADIVQCGLLLALILFSRYLRLTWHSYAFGIAVGLGIFATVDLAISAILMESGKLAPAGQTLLQTTIDIVSMAAYLVAAMVWLAYTLIPEAAPKSSGMILHHDLDAWNRELQRLLPR
jgi:hypothetical protein